MMADRPRMHTRIGIEASENSFATSENTFK
jgi:hypothetical protein